MILSGIHIALQVKKGKIKVDPFLHSNVTTNSYDLHLGNTLIKYTDKILDPKKEPRYKTITIPKEGYVLTRGSFHLGSTVERIGSDYFVPIIHAKSNTARMGLFVHVTADLIDIGSYGVSTLQLYATVPVRIYPYMPIAQVSFWVPKGKIKLYDGKYQNSTGPMISQCYKDAWKK